MILLTTAASAHPAPEALELVRRYVSASGRELGAIRQQLSRLDVGGPEFVAGALEVVATDPRKWSKENDPRAIMLMVIARAIRESLPWPGFAGSALERQIHAHAQVVLSHFPRGGPNQADVLRIFDRLDLWDATDFDFLARKIFNDYRYLPRLIQVFDGASPQEKADFLVRVRKNHAKRDLGVSALAYRTGLMERAELEALLRLYASDLRGKRGRRMIIGFADDPDGPFSEASRARDERLIEEVVQGTLADLRRRADAGDPAVAGVRAEIARLAAFPTTPCHADIEPLTPPRAAP